MKAVRLEHSADGTGGVREGPVRDAVHESVSARGVHEAEEYPQRRALAGPVRAEEAGDPSLRDRERQLVDRHRRPEALRQLPHLDGRSPRHQPASRSTRRYTLRGSATWSISSEPATRVPYPSIRPGRLCSSPRFSTERRRTADAFRRSVPETTNSFSAVTTRWVRSQSQTARSVSSAAAITSSAPGRGIGHLSARRNPPRPASRTAWPSGRASTTPCRRASR